MIAVFLFELYFSIAAATDVNNRFAELASFFGVPCEGFISFHIATEEQYFTIYEVNYFTFGIAEYFTKLIELSF